jgi:hypothetical protein
LNKIIPILKLLPWGHIIASIVGGNVSFSISAEKGIGK